MLRGRQAVFIPVRSGWMKASFCSDRGSKKKIQTVGFANSNIENIKHLSYKLKAPIKYENGKFLIYRSKWSLIRWLRDYAIYLGGISYLVYLIYNRINFDFYPIIKHAYVGGIALLLFFMARKFLKNHNIVREIHLLEGGKASQVVFQNQLKRKLFGEMLQSTYYNSIFSPPKEGDHKFVSMNQLPRDLQKVESNQVVGSYWVKNFSNDDNYLLIPKSYEFMHIQIMVKVRQLRIKQ